MENRDSTIAALREPIVTSGETNPDEAFQNRVLRPILKIQNELFLDVFRNYVAKYKSDFYQYSPEKKMQYIENAIHKDIKFRNSLKGMVIGLFTIEEYSAYITNSSSLNKRMMNMVIERLKSQVQLCEE